MTHDSTVSQVPLSIDREKVLLHLTVLGKHKSKTIHLRVFPPDRLKNKLHPENKSFTDAEAAIPWLQSKQVQEYGLYLVVNDGGHSDKDITNCVAIFCEWDDIPKPEQLQRCIDLGLPKPSLRVETQKSIHFYWVLKEPASVEQWLPLQKDLLAYTQSDQTLKNPSRVLRLAGSWHTKSEEPFPCDIKTSNATYDYATLRESIPVSSPPQPQNFFSAPSEWEGFADEEELNPQLRKALSEETLKVRKAQPGERNDTLNRSAFKLGQLVDEGLPEDKILKYLTQACTTTGNGLLDDPNGMHIVEDCIIRAIKAGMDSPRQIKNSKGSGKKKEQPRTKAEKVGRFEYLPDFESIEDLVEEIFLTENQENYAYFRNTWFERNGVVVSKVEDSYITQKVQKILSGVFMMHDEDRITNFNTINNLKKGVERLQISLSNKFSVQRDERNLYFNNGVVDYTTKELRPPASNEWTLIQYPYAYQPCNDPPALFKAFVESSYGIERLEQIRAIINYLHDPTPRDWKYVVYLLGDSRTGKGVLGSTIAAGFPPSAVTVENDLERLNTMEGRYQLLFPEKSLFYGDDLELEMSKNKAFYSLVMNMPMSLRKLHGNETDPVKFNTKFLLASTSFPKLKSTGQDGFAQRLLILPTLPKHKITKLATDELDYGSLETALAKLAPEIACWAMSMPPSDRSRVLLSLLDGDEKKALRLTNDIYACFIDECMQPSESKRYGAEPGLYEVFVVYAKFCNKGVPQFGAFKEAMRRTLHAYFKPEERKKVDGKTVRLPNRYEDLSVRPNLFSKNEVSDELKIKPQFLGSGGLEDLGLEL